MLEYLDITNIEIKQGQAHDLPPNKCELDDIQLMTKKSPSCELEKLLLEESKEYTDPSQAAFVAASLDRVDRVLDEQLKKSSGSQGSDAS